MNTNRLIDLLRRRRGLISGIALAILIAIVIGIFVVLGGSGKPGSTPAVAAGGTSVTSSSPANPQSPKTQGSTPANGTSTTTAPPTSSTPATNTAGAPAPGTTTPDDPYSGRSAGCMKKANEASHIPAVIDPQAASLGMSLGDNQLIAGGEINAACLYSVTLPRAASQPLAAYCRDLLVAKTDYYLLHQDGSSFTAFFNDVAQRLVKVGMGKPNFGGIDNYRSTRYENPENRTLKFDGWYKVEDKVCNLTSGYTKLSVDVSSVGES